MKNFLPKLAKLFSFNHIEVARSRLGTFLVIFVADELLLKGIMRNIILEFTRALSYTQSVTNALISLVLFVCFVLVLFR